MGVPGSANMLLAAGEAEAYEIDYSLRFDDSNNYLYRNFGTASSSTTQTWSFWMKIGWRPYADGTYHALLCSANNQTIWRFTEDEGSGNYEDFIQSGVFNGWSTRHSFADTNAWIHVMIVYDTTNSTASNRLRHYYNGVHFPKLNGSDPGSSANIGFGQSGTHNIGRQVNGGEYWEGLLAEFHMVDGQALDPTEFGEFSSEHGGWIPKAYSGTYGNNGFYLKMDPSATNGVGHDHSGNGNHWSASGFNTNSNFPTGDVLFDTPTTNCSNFVPMNNTEDNYGIFNSNQHVDTNSGTNVAPATFAVKSGKWYAEFEIDAWNSASAKFGWHDMSGDEIDHCERNTFTLMHYTNGSHYAWKNYGDGGTYTQFTSTAGLSAGDIVGLAFDADNNYAYLYVNGSLRKTIDLNGEFTAGTRYLAPWVGFAAGSGAAVYYCNFGGQFTQQYAPPSGYSVYRASNLPDPPIKNPKEYHKTVVYSGNGSNNHSITSVGFQPDLVWIKSRTVNGHDMVWTDSVRGTSKVLRSNTNAAEYTQTDAITSFDASGFTLGDDNSVGQAGNFNTSSYERVAWCWKKGATQGFDIVSYTGNASSTRSISHSLGVTPAMIIVKNRNNTANWRVWHQSIHATSGNTTTVNLSGTDGNYTSTEIISGCNSTTFSVKDGDSSAGNHVNGPSSSSYIAYLWSEVEGFSKFGQYPGNGNVNGTFVYTGFRVAWLMIKRSDSTNEWYIYDNVRDEHNRRRKKLYANRAYSEEDNGYNELEFLSNGFKLRDSSSGTNNGSYIFAAFAETPFKYAMGY